MVLPNEKLIVENQERSRLQFEEGRLRLKQEG